MIGAAGQAITNTPTKSLPTGQSSEGSAEQPAGSFARLLEGAGAKSRPAKPVAATLPTESDASSDLASVEPSAVRSLLSQLQAIAAGLDVPGDQAAQGGLPVPTPTEAGVEITEALASFDATQGTNLVQRLAELMQAGPAGTELLQAKGAPGGAGAGGLVSIIAQQLGLEGGPQAARGGLAIGQTFKAILTNADPSLGAPAGPAVPANANATATATLSAPQFPAMPPAAPAPTASATGSATGIVAVPQNTALAAMPTPQLATQPPSAPGRSVFREALADALQEAQSVKSGNGATTTGTATGPSTGSAASAAGQGVAQGLAQSLGETFAQVLGHQSGPDRAGAITGAEMRGGLPAGAEAQSNAASGFARNLLGQVRRSSFAEGRTRIELAPRGLGDIEIDLQSTDNGRMRVVLRAENPLVLQALRDDRQMLMAMLDDSGVQLDGASLDFEAFGSDRQTPEELAELLAQGAASTEDAPADSPKSRRSPARDGLLDITT